VNDNDLAIAVDFENPWLVPGFGEQNLAIAERLNRVHFGLCALELEQRFAITIHLDHRPAWVGFAFGHG
jgi:hypothetical protein